MSVAGLFADGENKCARHENISVSAAAVLETAPAYLFPTKTNRSATKTYLRMTRT
jgi:hypothetical protein